MRELRVRNVHRALPVGIALLQAEGIARKSRVGACIEYPEPVSTVYLRPWERVLFWPARDANPLFHLFESLHMLAGRDDVAWLSKFTKHMAQYSDNGETFHGAYGARWRWKLGQDQLVVIERMLRDDPDTRRAVLQMWHAPLDLGTKTLDTPCNDLVFFKVRDGAFGGEFGRQLHMTVCCRSNDCVFGAHGTNAVHFSFLQEYLASRLGLSIGPYTQVSDSYHAYEGVWEKCWGLPVDQPCPYELGTVSPERLGAGDPGWDADLADLFTYPSGNPGPYRTRWFETTVKPLYLANELRQAGAWEGAVDAAQECASTDWRRATVDWLQRRIARREALR